MEIKRTKVVIDQNSHHNDLQYKYVECEEYLSVSKFEFESECENIIIMIKRHQILSLDIHFGGESSYPLDLSNLNQFHFIKELSISGGDYINYDYLENLTNLVSLFIFNDEYNKVKVDLSRLINLKSLIIRNKVMNINGFNKLPNLETLYLENYKPKSKNLVSFLEMRNMRYLYLYKSNIIDFSGIKSMNGLRYLGIEDCRNLANIQELTYCQKLKMISFVGCKKIVDFSVLGTLQEVVDLRLFNCKEIRTLSFINRLSSLRVINLFNTVVHDNDITPLKNIAFALFDKKKEYYEKEFY